MNLMPEEIPIDYQRDYMDDGDHLNCYGAEKPSAYLGKYLSEQNLFADKRTLPEFAAWNAALAEYRAFVQSDVDS